LPGATSIPIPIPTRSVKNVLFIINGFQNYFK
jgi:hypothetical protein